MPFAFAIAIGQPLPCEQQGRERPAPAIVADRTDLATAKSNREAIEQELRGGGTVNLPAGLIAVDRAIRLPRGCTLAGVGPQTVVRNCHTGAPFWDACTLVIHPSYNDPGIGYADDIEPVSKTVIRVKDQAAFKKYQVGGWIYTYKWDGYLEPLGARTKVARIIGKGTDTLTLSGQPDPKADKAAYVTTALRVSGASEGSSVIKIAAGQTAELKPGSWVWITEGPTRGNECTGELRRVVRYGNQSITVDRPLRSTHPYTEALAVLLNPVENVIVRDLTIQAFSERVPPCFFERVEGLTMQRVTSEGQIDLVLCTNVRLYGCLATSSIKLNGTRDAIVSGGRCSDVFMEEYCADVTIADLLVSGSGTAGINAVAGSPSERIAIRDCIVEGAKDMPIHLIGRECVVDCVTVRNSKNPVPWVNNYLGGDGLCVSNFRSDLPIVIRSGRDVIVSRIPTKVLLGWSGPGDQPTGVCVACPNVNTSYLTPAAKAQWTITTAAVD